MTRLTLLVQQDTDMTGTAGEAGSRQVSWQHSLGRCSIRREVR